MMDYITYRAGYKYQLLETYTVSVAVKPAEDITGDEDAFISLDKAGLLKLRSGYAWDGPSGPAIDTKNFMRGSLVHDALYQLMRERHLPQSCRKEADLELYRICREDGMSSVRAKWVYRAVRTFAKRPAHPISLKEPLYAP